MSNVTLNALTQAFGEESRADPKMKPFFDRLQWNKDHLWDFKNFNPYITVGEGDLTPKKRLAYQDYFHSLKNIPVEWQRLQDQKV